MAYWGGIWASAEYERVRIESEYRSWRANKKIEILRGNPKLAEWKVTQEIQSLTEYRNVYEKQAQAIKNVTLAKSIFQSHQVKANMLQSKGAMLRAELDYTDMKTPSTKSKKDGAKVDKQNIEKMKKIMKKGKRK
jgi:hypothetical protein